MKSFKLLWPGSCNYGTWPGRDCGQHRAKYWVHYCAGLNLKLSLIHLVTSRKNIRDPMIKQLAWPNTCRWQAGQNNWEQQQTTKTRHSKFYHCFNFFFSLQCYRTYCVVLNYFCLHWWMSFFRLGRKRLSWLFLDSLSLVSFWSSLLLCILSLTFSSAILIGVIVSQVSN